MRQLPAFRRHLDVIRRFLLFVKTYRQARKLGFTVVDAMRTAKVNSRAA
jgi:hypothetical protein